MLEVESLKKRKTTKECSQTGGSAHPAMLISKGLFERIILIYLYTDVIVSSGNVKFLNGEDDMLAKTKEGHYCIIEYMAFRRA